MTIAYGGPAAVGFASLFCAGSPGPSFATALRVLIALRLGLVARLASSFARFVLAVANTAPVTLRQIGVLVVVFYFYVEVGLALYGVFYVGCCLRCVSDDLVAMGCAVAHLAGFRSRVTTAGMLADGYGQ